MYLNLSTPNIKKEKEKPSLLLLLPEAPAQTVCFITSLQALAKGSIHAFLTEISHLPLITQLLPPENAQINSLKGH